jgi:hypothetical protein
MTVLDFYESDDVTKIEDSDKDGISDYLEAMLNTNPNSEDSDDDGESDSEELENGSNPRSDIPESPLLVSANRIVTYGGEPKLIAGEEYTGIAVFQGNIKLENDWNDEVDEEEIGAPYPFTLLDEKVETVIFPETSSRENQVTVTSGGNSSHKSYQQQDNAELKQSRIWLKLPHASDDGVKMLGYVFKQRKIFGELVDATLDEAELQISKGSLQSEPLELLPEFTIDQPSSFTTSSDSGGEPMFPAAPATGSISEEVIEEFSELDLKLCTRSKIGNGGKIIPRPASNDQKYLTKTIENADLDQYKKEQGGLNRMRQEDTKETAHQDCKKNLVNQLTQTALDHDDDFCKIYMSHAIKGDWSVEMSLSFNGAAPGPLAVDKIRMYDKDGMKHGLNALNLAKTKFSEMESGPVKDFFDSNKGLYLEISDLGQTTSIGEATARTDYLQDRLLKMVLTITIYYPKADGEEDSKQFTRDAYLMRSGFWMYDRRYDNGLELNDGLGNVDSNGKLSTSITPDPKKINTGETVAGPWDVKNGAAGFTSSSTKNRGPTPVGWYFISERVHMNAGKLEWVERLGYVTDVDYMHKDGSYKCSLVKRKPLSVDDKVIVQGRMSVWMNDIGKVVKPAELKEYNAIRDGADAPVSAAYKFDMLPGRYSGGTHRDALQIHPDGYPRGTQGCIGLQEYHQAIEVQYLMRHMKGVGLAVINDSTNAWNTASDKPKLKK